MNQKKPYLTLGSEDFIEEFGLHPYSNTVASAV